MMGSPAPTWQIIEGDCLEAMRAMPEASVDAIVCDPPYGLEFMGKDWDRPWRMGKVSDTGDADGSPFRRNAGTPSWAASGNPVCRNCGGTKYDRARPNGCSCDAPDFPNEAALQMRAFQAWCEEWAREALRVLKPGGHLLAFGGTRTYHRLTCAIEDAGFEVRDCIAWMYGSGFPKSLDVSKAIDKAAPRRDLFQPFAEHYAERRAAAGLTHAQICATVGAHGDINHGGASVNWERGYNVPTLDQWQALVPLLGLSGDWQPLIEREEAGRAKVGERNGTRLAIAPGQGEDRSAVGLDVTASATPEAQAWEGWGTALKPAHEPIVVARKPLAGTVAANVLRHGTGALNIDGARIGMSDEDRAAIGAKHAGMDMGAYERAAGSSLNLSVRPMPLKAAEAHELGRWPANVVLDGGAAALLDAEHDDAGGPSRFFYCAKASTAERSAGVDRNVHPTVKPIDLMRWLVRLVTPPGGLVLDPFTGSGTTGCAAVLEGFRFIGLEREAEYVAIARARIEWWAQQPRDVPLERLLGGDKARTAASDRGQGSIFDVIESEAA